MRIILFILLMSLALTGTAAGALLIYPSSIAPQLRDALLKLTPFNHYALAGAIILLAITGSVLFALYHLFTNSVYQYKRAGMAGVVIGIVSALSILFTQSIALAHFVLLAASLLIVLIAYQLNGKWAV